MTHIRSLRDLAYEQPLDYPSPNVDIDRERAGQLGVTVEQVGRSLVAATSSSRFVTPNYWRDPSSGIAYQVQVEIPQSEMTSIQDVESIPAMPGGASRPLVVMSRTWRTGRSLENTTATTGCGCSPSRPTWPVKTWGESPARFKPRSSEPEIPLAG